MLITSMRVAGVVCSLDSSVRFVAEVAKEVEESGAKKEVLVGFKFRWKYAAWAEKLSSNYSSWLDHNRTHRFRESHTTLYILSKLLTSEISFSFYLHNGFYADESPGPCVAGSPKSPCGLYKPPP